MNWITTPNKGQCHKQNALTHLFPARLASSTQQLWLTTLHSVFPTSLCVLSAWPVNTLWPLRWRRHTVSESPLEAAIPSHTWVLCIVDSACRTSSSGWRTVHAWCIRWLACMNVGAHALQGQQLPEAFHFRDKVSQSPPATWPLCVQLYCIMLSSLREGEETGGNKAAASGYQFVQTAMFCNHLTAVIGVYRATLRHGNGVRIVASCGTVNLLYKRVVITAPCCLQNAQQYINIYTARTGFTVIITPHIWMNCINELCKMTAVIRFLLCEPFDYDT